MEEPPEEDDDKKDPDYALPREEQKREKIRLAELTKTVASVRKYVPGSLNAAMVKQRIGRDNEIQSIFGRPKVREELKPKYPLLMNKHVRIWFLQKDLYYSVLRCWNDYNEAYEKWHKLVELVPEEEIERTARDSDTVLCFSCEANEPKAGCTTCVSLPMQLLQMSWTDERTKEKLEMDLTSEYKNIQSMAAYFLQ